MQTRKFQYIYIHLIVLATEMLEPVPQSIGAGGRSYHLWQQLL